MRQMVMVGFLQAQNRTNLVNSWRHPESCDDTSSADYYQTIGRVLEAGKFHVGFFDDRLAMPDRYGNDHRHTVEHGIRCVKLDPITVLTVMGMATSRLGLGGVGCITRTTPARRGGRIWGFRYRKQPPHDKGLPLPLREGEFIHLQNDRRQP
ncbi:MAG: hypothetical protein ABSC95_32405 [Acetobacteraceae bacterium]